MKKLFLVLGGLFFWIQSLQAQNLNMGGVVNEYTQVLDIITNCRIKVRDPQKYSVGQQVLIIQMKGAGVNKTNTSSFGDITALGPAGLFEFNYIDSIFGDTIDLVYMLKSPDYNVNTKLQMISVPTADVFNITGTLTGNVWNDTTGGVVVIEARDSIIMAADVSANSLGFKGGVRSSPNYTCAVMDYSFGLYNKPYNGGYKGESFVMVDGNHITGRGPWATGGGGGNNHNTGGGGGGNISAGGHGGKQAFVNSGTQGCNDTTTANGGIGGKPFDYSSNKNRVFLGGGGGGGHQNDLPSAGGGEAGTGGHGGGIVILVAPVISSYNRTIFANGESQDSIAGRDGGGGGGGGGSILLFTNQINGTLNIQARGGKGADNNSHNSLAYNLAATHGTGGGGGGGYIGYSSNTPLSNIHADVRGGLNGKILNSGSNNYGGSYGATAGGDGDSVFGLVLPRGNGFCKPTVIIAYPDQSRVTKNTPKIVKVKQNDLYNRNVRISICKGAQNGFPLVQNFDSVKYTPNTGFVGKDSFMYCMCTLLQPPACDTAWVYLDITEVQVKAIDDSKLTYYETPVKIDVLANDSVNVPVSASLQNPPLYGSASWNGSTFDYMPPFGFIGYDSFTYIICSSTSPVVCDTASVVVNVIMAVSLKDDYADVQMNKGTFIYPKKNDIVNIPAVLSVYEPPKHGTYVVQNGDSIFYTPDFNFFGYDTIKYQVCGYNPITICDSATIFIRVVPQVIATDDYYNLFINRSKRSKVLSNDTVFGSYSTTILSFPKVGTAVMQGDSIFYQSGLYYKGKDSLEYLVCSNLIPGYCDTAKVYYTTSNSIKTNDDVGTTLEDIPLSIFVTQNDIAQEAAQVVVMVNPRRGSASVISNDSIHYVPNPDYNGMDSIRYGLCTIEKPSICDTSWVRITIIPQNDPPVAAFDTATTFVNRAKTIDVLANDHDPDNDPMTVYLLDQPLHGMVSLENNKVIYTPKVNYIGQDRFRYAACDNAQPPLCDSTDVFVTIVERTELIIQEALSPNMDGINDQWKVVNIDLTNENEIFIMNRWGSVVWQTKNYKNDWTGVNQDGQPLPEGTYFYVIKVPEEGRVYKGFIVIQRD
ncbi:MAG: tandem-95 repeat protein [Bacteroidetes bacterium]|nr:tandem-95 repeat protein [Bacteroidota bacterium]